MRSLFAFVTVVAALVAAACAPAATPAPAARLEIVDAWARAASLMPAATATPDSGMMAATPAAGGEMGMGMGGVNSAIYLTIKNPTAAADRLIKAQSDVAASVELHTMAEENGVMKMHPVDGVDVPAQGEAVLKPGGFHIMLLNIARDLKVGDKVTVTLTFEKAGTLTVEAEVRER